MERTIKIRHIQKDIKVLDKTATAAEHLKGAYIRTRESAEQTQTKEQGSPILYAEDQRMEKGERAARGTIWQAGKQGKKGINTVAKKGRSVKETESFRQKNQEPDVSSFSSGREDCIQQKNLKKRTGIKKRQMQRSQITLREKKEIRFGESPKQSTRLLDRGVKTIQCPVKPSEKTVGKGTGRTIKTASHTRHRMVRSAESSVKATAQGAKKVMKKAQKTALTAKQTAVVTAKISKSAAVAAKTAIIAVKALISAVFAGGWIVVLILLTVILFGTMLSMIGGSNSSTVAPVSAEVEAYEPVIRQYARQYGIEEYVELIKAVMMQESGGRGNDPMQASECGYNTRYPNTQNGITDPEYSIDVGIQNLTACLREAGVESPVDMNHIKLALQGYNYGNGYISWAKENYGGYTYANAVEFSVMMAEQNGWSSYGDTEYVTHVLRYYVFGRIPAGVGNQAIVQVALTQEGNGGDTYWSWYGFSSREEWCACFVSWCADQCGYIEAGVIPRFSLCSAGMEWFESRGQFMDGSYVPAAGDIIFFDWGNDGSIDHVGIVESVVDGTVYTVEGNSGDKVARRSYPIGYEQIEGYGVLLY